MFEINEIIVAYAGKDYKVIVYPTYDKSTPDGITSYHVKVNGQSTLLKRKDIHSAWTSEKLSDALTASIIEGIEKLKY